MRPGGLLEGVDESSTDDPAFRLRVRHAGEAGEEVVAGFHVDERHVKMPSEGLFDLLGLASTQEPGVHEHAGQLTADGPVHQERRDARIHPTGQGAVDLRVADGGADPLDRVLDDVGRRPIREQPAPIHQEPLHDRLPVRRV